MALIRSPFSFTSTATDVLHRVDLHGVRVVVTGGGGGLGRATARALAAVGADVTVTVRRPAEPPGPAIRTAVLDLADLDSVRAFASSWRGPLHVLINNAGGILPTLQRTVQGWERQFAAHHIGHFALAGGLLDALTAGAAERGEGRIVTLSSAGHLASPVVFDDLHFRFRQYTDLLGYAQSKTANVLFGVGAEPRWATRGIHANAAMPGPTYTGFQRGMDADQLRARAGGADLDAGEVPLGWKTLDQGIATTVFLATSPLVKGAGGGYFEDCNEAAVATEGGGYRRGVAPFALDRANAERLWEVSEAMVAS